jgi:hypothetical protein
MPDPPGTAVTNNITFDSNVQFVVSNNITTGDIANEAIWYGTDSTTDTIQISGSFIIDSNGHYMVWQAESLTLRQRLRNVAAKSRHRLRQLWTYPRRRRERIERERRIEEKRIERDQAEARARSLLEELFVLVPGEKFIRVKSELHENREYRIPLSGDLPQVWIDGKLDHKLCIGVRAMGLPRSDVVAARALLASCSEEEFLELGNFVSASVV